MTTQTYCLGIYPYRNTSSIVGSFKCRLLEFDVPQMRRLSFVADTQGLIDPYNILTNDGWSKIQLTKHYDFETNKYQFTIGITIANNFDDLRETCVDCLYIQHIFEGPLILPGNSRRLEECLKWHDLVGLCSSPHQLLRFVSKNVNTKLIRSLGWCYYPADGSSDYNDHD